MLRVFKTSGQEVLAVNYDEFVEMVSSNNEPVRVLDVKRHLQPLCGQSRFKQRLLLPNGEMLCDKIELKGPTDLQLVFQTFEEASDEQVLALQHAAFENRVADMERLLQRPQDPDLQRDRVRPALHFACEYGRIEAARLLLEAGADKDKSATENASPIHLAAFRGQLEIVRLLVEARADMERPVITGATPLSIASQGGYLEIVRLLLESKANKDKAGKDGATALFEASQEGHVEIARLLLQANPDKDKPTCDLLVVSREQRNRFYRGYIGIIFPCCLPRPSS